jgi:hypothetical protein
MVRKESTQKIMLAIVGDLFIAPVALGYDHKAHLIGLEKVGLFAGFCKGCR